jgi:hypothetical protein
MSCHHLNGIEPVPPHTLGCEECLELGTPWVHLRVRQTSLDRWERRIQRTPRNSIMKPNG